MRILKNKTVVNSRLYDSDNYNELYTQKNIQLSDGRILSFTPNDADFKYLKFLFNQLELSDKERIIKEGRFSNKQPAYLKTENDVNTLHVDYYGTETLMGLKYSIIENYLVVITMGEKQPGRWIIVVEGVWEFLD